LIYLIGSLRNPVVGDIAKRLRDLGYEVFDDWRAAGEEADDKWRDYEKARGHDYQTALKGYAAHHVFHFDKTHIDRADVGVLVLPAGKSAHLELGYMIGRGKPGFILLDQDPERFDVMYLFSTAVCRTIDELVGEMQRVAYTIGNKASYDHYIDNAIAPDFAKKIGKTDDYEGGWCWRTFADAAAYKASHSEVDLGPDGKMSMDLCDIYRLRLPTGWDADTIHGDSGFDWLLHSARLFRL
jgi:hypothetical protein